MSFFEFPCQYATTPADEATSLPEHCAPFALGTDPVIMLSSDAAEAALAPDDSEATMRCVPCGADQPMAAFQPSAIVKGVKRCRSCANALVRTSARRQRQRNPRRQSVSRVQRRTHQIHGTLTPSWVGSAGIVQSVLEAAGWRSALGSSERNLVVVRKQGAVGEWTPLESVCVTVAEAAHYPQLPVVL